MACTAPSSCATSSSAPCSAGEGYRGSVVGLCMARHGMAWHGTLWVWLGGVCVLLAGCPTMRLVPSPPAPALVRSGSYGSVFRGWTGSQPVAVKVGAAAASGSPRWVLPQPVAVQGGCCRRQWQSKVGAAAASGSPRWVLPPPVAVKVGAAAASGSPRWVLPPPVAVQGGCCRRQWQSKVGAAAASGSQGGCCRRDALPLPLQWALPRQSCIARVAPCRLWTPG